MGYFRDSLSLFRAANAIKMFRADEIRPHEAACMCIHTAGQTKRGSGAKRSFNFSGGREHSIKAGVFADINPDCATKCDPLVRSRLKAGSQRAIFGIL